MKKLFLFFPFLLTTLGVNGQRTEDCNKMWSEIINDGYYLSLQSYGLLSNGVEVNKLVPSEITQNKGEHIWFDDKNFYWMATADGNYIFEYKIDGQYLYYSNKQSIDREGRVKEYQPDFSSWLKIDKYERLNGNKFLKYIFTTSKEGTYRYFVPVKLAEEGIIQNTTNVQVDENFQNALFLYEESIDFSESYKTPYNLKTEKQYKALSLFQKSFDPRAKYYIDYLHKNGYTYPTEGFSESMLRRAKSGDVKAMLELGQCYHFGIDVEHNLKEAERWYLKCNKAVLKLKSPSKEEIKWSNTSVHLYAILQMTCYTDPQKQAHGWISMYNAAKADFLPAMYDLANSYIYLATTENNLSYKKDALNLYQQATMKGDRLSSKKLYQIYNNPYLFEDIVVRDTVKAFTLYKLAAEYGDVEGQVSVGRNYLVNHKWDSALRFFEMANENEEADAPAYLGLMYENEMDVNKDIIKAEQYYRISVARESPIGYYFFGKFLYNNRRFEEAFEYLKRAAEGVRVKNNYYSEARNQSIIARNEISAKWGDSESPLMEKYEIVKVPLAMRMLAACYRNKGNQEQYVYWMDEAKKYKEVSDMDLLK